MAAADEDRKARLEALDAKLAERRDKDAPKRHQDEHYSQAHVAWRMVLELVVGLGIGFGIGFGLDTLFGTVPWLMIVFTLFGFAAGIRTMMHTAKEIQPPDASGDDKQRD